MIFEKAQNNLGIEFEVIFVIYVGIGCGAGWAAELNDLPAILFGLENIAECGWSSTEAIQGLIAHELSHLVHFEWRNRQDVMIGSGGWWQLYEEGFAQACEGRILSTKINHQAKGEKGQEWLRWCQENKGKLAMKFLEAMDNGDPVNAFFGSWFDIDGFSQTGYFLGQELVEGLLHEMKLEEVALLKNVEDTFRPVLANWASELFIRQ